MKIKMKKSTPGSPDGIRINLYKKGEVYDVDKSLGEVFVNQMEVAEKVVFGSPVVNSSPSENSSSFVKMDSVWIVDVFFMFLISKHKFLKQLYFPRISSRFR